MDDNSRFVMPKTHLFQCDVFEFKRGFIDLVSTIGSAGMEDKLTRHLRGQADQVLRGRAIRLDMPAKFTC